MQKTDMRVDRPIATLKQQVVDKLRSAVFSMRFLPGERLVERELCEMLGVSRTLVRESLSQLEAEGLVKNIPHKGPIVAKYTAEEAKGIYETRAVLEELAGRSFVARATDKEVQALEKALREVERAYKSKKTTDWLAAKSGFYSVLLNGARNPALTEMLRLILGRVTMLRATTMSQPGRHETSIQELTEIVRAIKARDSAGAANACRRHVVNAAEVAIAALSE